MVALALPLWLVSFLSGQAVNARITGDVQNEEGQYLAGVYVVAINISNNAETSVFTGGEKGTFRFLGLAPGIYQVSFDMEGYQPYVASGIRLSADESATLHIKLKSFQGDGDVLPVIPRPQASPPPSGPWKKWQLEFSAGEIFNEQADMSAFITMDRWFFNSKAHSYMYAYNLTPNNVLGEGEGQFKPLHGGRPLTVRVRFSLNKTFSLALGIGYFTQEKFSTYTKTYILVDYQPESIHFMEEYTLRYQVPDFMLGVKGYFPHLGAQASVALDSNLRLVGFVYAGWMFAECRYSSRRRLQDGFFDQNSSYEAAMNGRGSGLTLEGGAKLEFDVWRGLGLFVEGVYQSCRLKKVNGESYSSEIVQDRESLEVVFQATENRNGRWVLGGEEYPYPFIPSAGDAAEYDPFTLDLGGFGVRAGLFFRF